MQKYCITCVSIFQDKVDYYKTKVNVSIKYLNLIKILSK